MRAADAGWVVAGGDTAAFACLDFMALRVPVIADRSPLTQHYVADRHQRRAARARRSVLYGRRRRGVPHRRGQAQGDGKCRPHARAARLSRDGDDRRLRARGDAAGRSKRLDDQMSDAGAIQPSFAHRAEYVALRGAVAAIERLSFRRAGRIGARIGRPRLHAARHPARSRRAPARRGVSRPGSGRDRARIARASYAHLGRTSIETAILPSYVAKSDHRSVRDGERLGHRRGAPGAGQGTDHRHRPPRQLGARRGVYRRARRADRCRRAAHGKSAVRPVPHDDARADGHDRRARRRGGPPRAAGAALRPGGGVSRRPGRGGPRVDVGAVLRPLRQDAARAGGVRAAPRQRRSSLVSRCGSRRAGIGSPSSRSMLSTPAIAKPTSIASSVEYTAVLERWVRQAPEQYLWHHRRWKHQRPGTPPELGDPL